MDNKIDLYENQNKLLYAAVDKITVKIIDKKKNDGAQVMAVTACSPLAGTTSTTISLAIAMATTSRKTILMDCDVRKAGMYKKLNDSVGKGLAEYITANPDENISLDELLYSTNVDNLYYIPCGTTEKNTTRILCSEKLEQLIGELRKSFDCVILDCPSISVVPDAQIMFKMVDGIIVVAALGETKRSQIKDTRRLMMDYQDKYYGMIINKIPRDIYRKNVKNSDYYITDKKGRQRFEKMKAFKKYKSKYSKTDSDDESENAD